jgi:hypothetical protein
MRHLFKYDDGVDLNMMTGVDSNMMTDVDSNM